MLKFKVDEWLVHTADADKTRQCGQAISCKLKTGSRRDKTHRNWVETRQNCLVGGVNTTQLATRQQNTVLSRPHGRCEQAIRIGFGSPAPAGCKTV